MKRAVQALLRRIGYKLVRSEPSQEVLRPGPDGVIRASAWGRELVMGSDHHLPRILAGCPRFSEPIALLVKAMPQERVRFIDVGANIGDTVAMVESFSPGKCTYLCIEPDGAFLEFCRANTKSVKAVTILQAIVDEGDSKPFSLNHYAPGTAAPAQQASDKSLLSSTLDNLAANFVSLNGGVDIIKIDTDGFDAKVLRSGSGILRAYKPMLFFEFHPRWWERAQEDLIGAVAYLQGLDYHHFVFFGNRGTVYAQISDPTTLFLETLTKVSESRLAIDDFHYDILAGDLDICRAVVESSLRRTAETGLL